MVHLVLVEVPQMLMEMAALVVEVGMVAQNHKVLM